MSKVEVTVQSGSVYTVNLFSKSGPVSEFLKLLKVRDLAVSLNFVEEPSSDDLMAALRVFGVNSVDYPSRNLIIQPARLTA